MARTVEPPLLMLIVHRTHQVRAALAVSGEFALAPADKNARMVRRWITEEFRSAHWNLLDAANPFGFGGARREEKLVLRQGTGANSEHGTAGDFDELPARDLVFGGLPDRVSVFPVWI